MPPSHLKKKITDEQIASIVAANPTWTRDQVGRYIRHLGYGVGDPRLNAAITEFAHSQLAHIAIPNGATLDMNLVREKIRSRLVRQNNPMTISEISKGIKIDIDRVVAALESMEGSGVNLVHGPRGYEIQAPAPSLAHEIIDVKKFNKGQHLYGVTGDNHLCSRYERLDVLNALFDIWQSQGVKVVYQCGNIIDGEARFNRQDLKVHGLKGQIDYLIDNWPSRPGMVTKFITGDDHEGWYIQNAGFDVGEMIEDAARRAGDWTSSTSATWRRPWTFSVGPVSRQCRSSTPEAAPRTRSATRPRSSWSHIRGERSRTSS